MARALLRLSAKLCVGTALLYAVFFQKLGAFTLYEHGKRIVGTAEARELGEGVRAAADDVAGVLGSGLKPRQAAPGP